MHPAATAGLGGQVPVVRTDFTDYPLEPGDFDTFFREQHGSLLSLAYSLSGSWAVAEELVQEAFLAALRRWKHVADLDRPDLWVRRVLLNRSASAYRRTLIQRRAMARRREPETYEDAEPADPAVLAELRRLPSRQAQALALVYLQGLDPAAAARVLHCSESTLRTHLQRGRAALRTRLEKRP